MKKSSDKELDAAWHRFYHAVTNVNRERDNLKTYRMHLALAVENLKHCKSRVEKCPITNEPFETVFFPENSFAEPEDICLNSKAYAYVLYFRKQIKGWEKKIRRQKEILRECNLQLSYANIELKKARGEMK